jgi:hypothetical protein
LFFISSMDRKKMKHLQIIEINRMFLDAAI